MNPQEPVDDDAEMEARYQAAMQLFTDDIEIVRKAVMVLNGFNQAELAARLNEVANRLAGAMN